MATAWPRCGVQGAGCCSQIQNARLDLWHEVSVRSLFKNADPLPVHRGFVFVERYTRLCTSGDADSPSLERDTVG